MTDVMMTKARAIEEQLSSMAGQLARHDTVIATIDLLYSMVQQHSESFNLMKKNHIEFFDILRNSLAA